jgi:sterol desaturase/sphingolipid hydroxylase (fatty acid hydroxylase superfamily)
MLNPLDFPLVHHWLDDMRVDVMRYVLFATGIWFVIWVLLAQVLRFRKIRKDTPKPKQMVREFFTSIRSIAIYSTFGLLYLGLNEYGLMWGPEIASGLGPIWVVVSFILMTIGHDAWFYWSHRIMHNPRHFKQFHRTHHQSYNPTPFTAYSFDMPEAAVHASFVIVWTLIFPTPHAVVSAYMIFQIARNTIGHCGYELFPADKHRRPLFDWMTTVTHHDLHHARAGYNFGLWFTWWDRWMGTEDPTYHARFAEVIAKKSAKAKAEAASSPDPVLHS